MDKKRERGVSKKSTLVHPRGGGDPLNVHVDNFWKTNPAISYHCAIFDPTTLFEQPQWLFFYSLFGRYYTSKRTRRIAANLAIYAANCVSIDHFLCLIIISSHSILIKSEKLEVFFSKICKKSSSCLIFFVM